MKSKLLWGLVPVLALALPLLAQSPTPRANPAQGYRRGKALLKYPVKMAVEVSRLCRNLTPEEEKRYAADPHFSHYAQVYINSIGQKALGQKSPKFPVGTVLVKEKLDGISKTPELLTAMVKREKGYNPACYDWEFLVLDGKAQKVLERGKIARCQGCHTETQYKQTDGVATLQLKRFLVSSGSR